MSTASSHDNPGGPLVIDGISYIPSSVLLTGIPKLTFKDNHAFGVLDPRGEAPRAYSDQSELGLYYNDTRYLSTWEMKFNDASPVALSHELRFGGNTLVISMTNRDMEGLDGKGRIPRDTLLIRRVLILLEDTLYEILAIRNFDGRDHEIQIEQWAGSRFDDIFEVRGYPREKRGRMLAADEAGPGGIRGPTTTLRYEGLDGLVRSLHIQRHFEAEKIRLSPSLIGHYTRVNIPSKQDVLLKTVISFDKKHDGKMRGEPFSDLSLSRILELASARDGDSPLFSSLRIESDNAILNRAVKNAAVDLHMLMTVEENGSKYPYAGIPWFSAPFGRDGIIAAYQMLPWHPSLAQGVLEYAFQWLGSRVDDFTDEQPGKVFHELRRGEMSRTREVPFIPYYGSVDSTPLCLILLHEYVSWTLDLESLRKWWPNALRALGWIEKWGDTDGDGFLEYQKMSPTGLVNQGWKDSHDSIMHEDGRLAQSPIRLCEVQGYAFRARMGMSELARMLGHHELSARLRMEALRLKARFRESFWNSAKQSIHLALVGKDREVCPPLSSNMGHCLWGGILDSSEAEAVSRHLMSSSMFSGYGIRTLADTERAYNPLSYHNGSIWPHDNSLILEGFRRYGRTEDVERLSSGLIGLLESSTDFRLPELFCGFRRRGNEPPVPYEVACKPQAWAAGTVFLMIKSMLGIGMDPDQSHLVFRSPTLTDKVGEMEITGLRARDWEVDVRIAQGRGGPTVEVLHRSGPVRVMTVR